jgi:glycosyltransferase involved in cell wall biosynthesis
MAEIGETTSRPMVSVIIATHNRSGFVTQAIQSVLAQSFTDLELIVIDDGSTDQTADVIGSYGDTRIQYEYQPQSGRSRARNRGLLKAKGEYIAFLDDDDAYFPTNWQQVAYLNQHRVRCRCGALSLLTSQASLTKLARLAGLCLNLISSVASRVVHCFQRSLWYAMKL